MADTSHYHKRAATHVWETPQPVFDALNAEFRFDVDVCALPENAKCAEFFCPKTDGLKQDWRGRVCWLNPPYGREIREWMRKAYESARDGATVVCLVPARTDAAWWHDYAMKGEVRFIKGRLRFSGMTVNAPFPSAVVVFRPGSTGVPTPPSSGRYVPTPLAKANNTLPYSVFTLKGGEEDVL